MYIPCEVYPQLVATQCFIWKTLATILQTIWQTCFSKKSPAIWMPHFQILVMHWIQDCIQCINLSFVFRQWWFGWVKIPCLFGAGSCTYDDVCSMIPPTPPSGCPQPLKDANIPCACPFRKVNEYTHVMFVCKGTFGSRVNNYTGCEIEPARGNLQFAEATLLTDDSC